MTKTLIAGLATIVVAGSALIATSMYAATGSTGTASSRTQGVHMPRQTPEQMIISLSGKVAPEAITAFTTLMARHKTEMDILKNSTGTTLDEASMQAKHTAFKTEMDTLMTQYPDLKTVLPQGGKMNNKGKGNTINPIDTILADVSATDKVALETIHTEYQAKEEALRTEKKAKIDTIIAKYPGLKTKLDTLKTNEKGRGHDGSMGGRGPRGR